MHTSFIVTVLLERERKPLVETKTLAGGAPDPEALIEEARRRQRRRRRTGVLALGLAAVIAAGAYLAVDRGGGSASTHDPNPPALGATHRSPIRVTLTAQNHQPRVSNSPTAHWGYCLKVRTAAGKSVASTIDVRILLGGKAVAGVGLISLKKGYDHWCQGIGGEASVLHAVPPGRKLIFQAVVRAQGVTVKRNWPIVVRCPICIPVLGTEQRQSEIKRIFDTSNHHARPAVAVWARLDDAVNSRANRTVSVRVGHSTIGQLTEAASHRLRPWIASRRRQGLPPWTLMLITRSGGDYLVEVNLPATFQS